MVMMARGHYMSRIRKAVFAVIFAFAAAVCAAAPQPDATATPTPAKTGKGVFLLDLDYETGRVTDVHVLQSTGNPTLDATSIRTFKKWKAKPRTYRHVKVPITYTLKN
jgi:TonB family protein